MRNDFINTFCEIRVQRCLTRVDVSSSFQQLTGLLSSFVKNQVLWNDLKNTLCEMKSRGFAANSIGIDFRSRHIAETNLRETELVILRVET